MRQIIGGFVTVMKIFLAILFFPITLVWYAWKRTNWPVGYKIAVTVIALLLSSLLVFLFLQKTKDIGPIGTGGQGDGLEVVPGQQGSAGKNDSGQTQSSQAETQAPDSQTGEAGINSGEYVHVSESEMGGDAVGGGSGQNSLEGSSDVTSPGDTGNTENTGSMESAESGSADANSISAGTELQINKEAYASTFEKLSSNYDEQVKLLKDKENETIKQMRDAYVASGFDTCDDQCAQSINGIKKTYDIQFEHLEEAYKLSKKSLEDAKYW